MERLGGGADGGISILYWDPATAHLTKRVRAALKVLRIHVVLIPASLTWKYQLVDVFIAAIFKRYISDEWTQWMVKKLERSYEHQEGFMKKSGNYIKPSVAHCVVWANKAWEKMKKHAAAIRKTADEKCYMGKEDVEMAPRMVEYYAGKFKCSYEPEELDADGNE